MFGKPPPAHPKKGNLFMSNDIACASGAIICSSPSAPEMAVGDKSPSSRKSRTKQDIAHERQELIDRTSREIDKLHAEHARRLPRERATSIGAAYARYSTKFQDSVIDQLRKILEEAEQLGIFVPREFIFFDVAVRGAKLKRPGLAELEKVLKARQVQVLLLFATSRLFRKTYRTLAFVDAVHKGLRIRCIFVQSGVDTNDRQGWEQLLAAQSLIDQFSVTVHVANIRAAHEGLLERQTVFGTISFGYDGEPIAGH